MGKRLVVVSNRVTAANDSKAQAGGLAVALQDALQESGGLWFGWSGKQPARPASQPTLTQVGKVTYATLDLSRKSFNEYYNGFANRALWPLFHYRLDLTAFERRNYDGYLSVNRKFADKLTPLLKPDDLLWVHDYHLIPLGEELRGRKIGNVMGFFLHIPFPAMEVLAVLPNHRELVKSLCAYDLVGFQTENDLRAFLDYIVHEAGGRLLENRRIHAFGRTLRAEIFPIGIDTEGFVRAGNEADKAEGAAHLRQPPGNRDWIIGIDRLDYSKGLIERFQAFEAFLDSHRGMRGRVTLLQIAALSRSEVPEYKDIQQQLEAMAGHINGRFAEFDWVPVNYVNKSYRRSLLAAFYRTSRIGLVTPLRDGMNLVAKEYVAAQSPDDPGVLVLSRFAGAARELEGALIVNPFDYEAVGDAIARGLTMSPEEKKERWAHNMKRLRTNTLTHWRDAFIRMLEDAPFE